MKKFGLLAMVFALGFGISGCGSSANQDPKNLGTLEVMFVPSKDPDKILEASKPLENILKTSLTEKGFTVDNVNVTVGDNYEVVGEGLASGTVDIGFIPSSTYVAFEDQGVEVLLSATRQALNNTSYDPKKWNENKPTEYVGEQVTYYDAIMVAGPSFKGKELGEKVNNGEKLTFEDVANATWCTSSPTSSSGYIYPNAWLQDEFGKSIDDLPNVVRANGYGDTVNSLASGVCDIGPGFADYRMNYADSWSGENDIWQDTNVIGVKGKIMNDTISVSNNSDIMSDELKTALIETFENLPNTEEGRQVMTCYSHDGYVVPNKEDYNEERRIYEQSSQK